MTTKTIEELQADLEKALASIAKLETKNSELIDREKKAKSAADAAEEAAEAAAAEAAAKAGDVDAVTKSLTKKFEAQIAKLTADRDAATGQLQTLLIDNTVTQALASNNVPAHAQRALSLLLREGAEVKGSEAFVGDVSLSDHISTFFSSDEGKHWLPAPANSGAGATGSSAKASTHGFTKENFDSRIGEWMALASSDSVAAKAIAESVGRTDWAGSL